MSNRVLHLTLKRQWFDMIASGEKKEEYREVSGFILPRLIELPNGFRHDQATIIYKRVTQAFWYSVGYKGKRSLGLAWLLENGGRWREYDAVTFQHGYKKDSDRVTVEFKGVEYRTGRHEWGAEPGKQYFIIKLGKPISHE